MSLLDFLTGKKMSFPRYWDDIRLFSVVIPFREFNIPRLEQTLRQALKLRSALINVARKQYFPNPIYEKILQKEEAGHPLSTVEKQYYDQGTENYNNLSCEKVHLILLWEKDWWDGLTIADHKAICDLANSFQDCDVISYPSEQLTAEKARSLVRRDARGGKVFYMELGTIFSNKQAEDALSRLITK